MSQTVTYSISAKFEKGPDLKSEAKVEVGSYVGIIEEQVCKCGVGKFRLPKLDAATIEVIIVSADKYKSDKECMPQGAAAGAMHHKHILWGWGTTASHPLTKPEVLSGLAPADDTSYVTFKNELTEDVKVSVLAILKKPEHE